MKHIDNDIRVDGENLPIITGDFSKIKNDNRNYILHVSPSTFMFLKFNRDLNLENIKVCFEQKFNENKLCSFKQIVNESIENTYFTLKTKNNNGYMLLDDNTNPFLCYRGLENSMPVSGSKVWILVEDGDDFDYKFTENKIISKAQIEFINKGLTKRRVLFDDTYIYYNISGKKKRYKRVIFSFPSVANPPVNFRFWDFNDRISKNDMVIAFSDWYGNFGTYMMKNDKKEDISSHVRKAIGELYAQYVKPRTEVIFVGISKGGWIANYFAQFFKVDQLWVTVPQLDIEHSFSDVISLNSSYRLNLIYFFKDDDMSKYVQTKLHGNYNQYVYSDLDYASDKEYGKAFLYDRAIVKRDEHSLVNLQTIQAWFPKGKSRQIKADVKMFKVNNNLNFNIKTRECVFTKEFRQYVPLITCKNTSVHAELEFTPSNTFVSNNKVNSIFPEYIKYHDELLSLELYAKDHSYFSKIPEITPNVENNLPNINIKAYLLEINNKGEKLEFNYEVECDESYEISNMHFVFGTRFYNKLPVGRKGTKEFSKTTLGHKKLELAMHIVVDDYEVILPFDFSKFKSNDDLKRETNFCIEKGLLINLDM